MERKRITIRLSNVHYEHLRKEAEKWGLTITDLIRLLILKDLEQAQIRAKRDLKPPKPDIYPVGMF